MSGAVKRWFGIAMVGAACGVLADDPLQSAVVGVLMVGGLMLWTEP